MPTIAFFSTAARRIAGLSTATTPSMATRYAQNTLPSWAPAPRVFGLVWPVLYVTIAVSFSYVGWRAIRGTLPTSLLWPLVANLSSNIIYTPLATLRNRHLANTLAFADVLVVLGSLAWLLAPLSRRAPWAAVLLAPYFAWVSFASTLAGVVWWRNRTTR